MKMKQASDEKIQDELDLEAIKAYEQRHENDEVEYIPFNEVKNRLGM